MADDVPVPNLWNVEDGVREYGGGTATRARPARLVVERIAAARRDAYLHVAVPD